MHLSQGTAVHPWAGAAACLHIHYLAVPIHSRLASSTLHGISYGSPFWYILVALEHSIFCVHVFFQFKEFKILWDQQFCPPAKQLYVTYKGSCCRSWGMMWRHFRCLRVKILPGASNDQVYWNLVYFPYNEGPSKWTIPQAIAGFCLMESY